MCYPDLRVNQAIIQMRLVEAQAITSSTDLPSRVQAMSTRRLRLLSHVGQALVGLGRRMTRAGLALQTPDLPQPSL
jgi:hypothetical protein